ncbi:MAG TPA: alanine--tRNA ligase [Candidatus Acidoferrales bacterium]|nr:alanine--tRNA ligase [Candidatus Acidoferrales bacterium]
MDAEELKWPGNRIRATFLKFFEERGHKIVRSSSLVPTNDPTLLFTNAGMNQFKDVFLGLEHRDYNRATTCQKCVRAGGKHNDLENVGFTNRHHTFFEMLGNFSFGDYFKKDAIAYAWELVTSPQWFAIPVDKLYFTVFGGHENLPPDHDAAKLWIQTGAPKDRVIEIPGLKENFWAMGDTGPCGPCSEIFYDMGPAASDQGHPDCKFPCDCGRYVEIWNLVFMQFNRDASGKLNPLPKPSVDTGMGLERVAAVLQGKISNFDTDLFVPLIEEAEKLTNLAYEWSGPDVDPSLRIIADHARACTFLVGDGVAPSNEGRGYVLRKIIRRALRHGRHLGLDRPFMHDMVYAVRDVMREAYPEISDSAERIAEIVLTEEKRFAHTVSVGLKGLESDIRRLREEDKFAKEVAENPEAFSLSKDEVKEKKNQVKRDLLLHGEYAFRLYDTYGLPLDFIREVLHDEGIKLDEKGFDRAMAEQQARSKASWKGAHKETASPVYRKLADTYKTEPDFYFGTTTKDCHIEAIVTKNGEVKKLKAGEEAEVVLDRTTIYSESGGQMADTGGLYDNDMSLQVAEVRGAYYPVAGLIAHRIVAKEDLVVGDRVATVADAARRARIMRNHTGTHLMNAALRNILGTHVKQAGSLNAPDHLRFDFSHFAQLAPEELQEIEQQVNEEILRDLPLHTDIMNIDDALASGALAFFGDKYPEQNVRVVTIDDAAYPRGFYSKELCGGTHVARTGEIGVFKISLEQSIAAGVRRIEAMTGDAALAKYQQALGTLRTLAGMLNIGEDRVVEAVEKLTQTTKQLEKQLEGLKRKSAVSMADSLLEGARTVKDVRVVAARVPGFDREALRQLADGLRQKMGSGVVFLAAGEPASDGGDGKVSIITAVTKDLTNRLHAGKMVRELAKFVGGSGGGRPDLAEAGGKDVAGIETAIAQVYPLVERML